MSDVQNFMDRQLGYRIRYNYDTVLKRLVVESDDSFYGLQGVREAAASPPSLDHDPPIFACRFAETAGYHHILALANEDGRVAIQDTRAGCAAATLASYQCHNNAVFDLAWMPKNMSFVTVSGDHTACLWDLGTGSPRCSLTLAGHSKSVKTAAFRPGTAAVLATGARDGRVLLWDTRAPTLRPDNCLVDCHALPAPRTPASHGKRARRDAPRAVSITGLAFQDESTLLSCGECDGTIKVWDMRRTYSAYTRAPLPRHVIRYCGNSTKNGFTNLAVDEERVRLYASCMDDVIYCFNVSSYSPLPVQRYVGHENRTFYIKAALSPDGAYLVSGSSDTRAYVWAVGSARPLLRLAGHRAEVTCAAWSRASEPVLVTCSDDARHGVWRVGRGEGGGGGEAPPCRAEPPPAVTERPLDRTPTSVRRRASPALTGGSTAAKRARTGAGGPPGKSKRCLADMLNATRDGEPGAKRPRPPASPGPSAASPSPDRLLPAGTKRPRNASPPGDSWGYISPEAGSSFMTPTKNYECKTVKILSPRRRDRGAPTADGVRALSFATPTKDLPDYVRTGEAPHLSLMSPRRPAAARQDWLTALVQQRAVAAGGGGPSGGPGIDAGRPRSPGMASPRALFTQNENVPPRRNSTTDKTPKSNKKTRTLLKYFSVTNKNM